MNINELDSYNLADAVKFHNRLNPRIWGRDEHLLPDVREKLLAIAADFQEFLGVDDLTIKDITVSGSNAAYSYTKNSDIDLHLVVEMPVDPVYQELFSAKKYQYNDEHDIRIGGADVELYVQPSDQSHVSQGIYSVKNNEWLSVPKRKRAAIDDACVRDKVADLDARIHKAVKSSDESRISALADKIKAMRKAGLDAHGEFGCENIAFKILRNKGCIKLLWDARAAARDRELSLRETPAERFRYGFGSAVVDEGSTPDGVSPTTHMFLNENDTETKVREFIQHVVKELGIDPIPNIRLHTDPEWSTHNHSFGRYDPDTHTLNVSMPNRHILDVLRTVAHELVHCSQHQQHGDIPDDAGETGSDWENDANARAGIIMRDWANTHPEHFEHRPLEENASGYIPKNKREARLPQYAMALSVDIKPGEVGRQANKLSLKTGRNGEPGLLQPDAQNLLREFTEFVTEQENLFEISMSPTSLKKLSAQTGARAGMEFEMIVPGVRDEDQDREPDYDYDERTRSIDDICNFFYDGDFNGRRQIDDLRRRLTNSYEQWADDQIQEDWDNQGMDLLYQYVKNNVDDETIIEALGLEPDEEGNEPTVGRAERASYAERCWEGQNDVYDEALQEFRDDWYNDDDHEDDWLQSEGLDYMSNVEQEYGGLVTWPHWNDPAAGETDVEQVADNFSAAIGRKVNWSRNYHGGKREPNAYVVEPDGSLDPDDPNDSGLEFVSPPLPIEELLSDLNTVKAWADKTGCYTNDSTGLHINVSVPGWSGDYNQLDYVKLAVLLGDEYVLDLFGRAGNTYAKSAMSKIRSIVKQNPAKAEELLTKMKSGMDQLASKAIHSGSTEKYTSINTKTGYIEFRSPGGDWLDANFDQIENTLRRFTVALSAAIDPEAYRKEYLKKLYKLLDVSSEKDPLSYFAKYAAGELPKAALKSFVRQTQLARKVKRLSTANEKLPWRLYDVSVGEWATDSNGQGVYFDGAKDEALRQVKEYIQNRRNSGDTHNYDLQRNPAAVPLWWRVYKEGKDARNGAVIEVVASSEKEAKEKAAKEWGFFSDEYKRAMDAEPLRPYKEETKGPELNGRPSNPDGNYVIVNGATNEPAYRYMASDGGDALTVLQQWITAHRGSGTQWNIKLDPNQSLGQPDQIAPPRGWASATQQAQSQQGNWGIWMRDANRFSRAPDQPDNSVLRRFPSREAAEQFIAQAQQNNPNIRTDIEVREIEPGLPGRSTNQLSQTDIENRLGWPDQTGDANYEVVDRQTMQPVFKFVANTAADAERKYTQIMDVMMMPHDTENYGWRAIGDASAPSGTGRPNDPTGRYAIVARNDTAAYGRRGGPAPYYYFRFNMGNPEEQRHGRYVLQAWAARNNVNSSDYMVVDTEEYADSGTAQDLPNLFPDLPRPQGQFTGEWRIMVNGEEVHRFGGIGNVQADANRVAAQWLRDNGRGVSGEGFEVVPVMSESLREYRMPQPSHGPGAIKDLNEPLGPETPPKMPDGTIKVDVSDMYDWYKLGQKISDLDSIKPGELGSGPPSTVFAFGSEDLENLYSHALTRLGLKTHDLDEPGEEDIDEAAQNQKAAGIILYAEDTGRFGLQQRSDTVNDPGVWAAWGGGRKPGESLEQCARRELAEEGGYTGDIKLSRLGSNPEYVTFIGRVPHEFEPRADSEWKDYCWVEAGDWPAPLHPGTAAALKRVSIDENFADGRKPGRKGLAKRMGVNTKASVSSLRKTAKNSSGEKQRMAHWLANMKAGKAKANEDKIGTMHFPTVIVDIDDHAIDRANTRKVNVRSIDAVLKKLESITDQLLSLELGNKVWVYDPALNVSLGLRRISSREPKFLLKSVLPSAPHAQGATDIINIPQQLGGST